MPRFDFHCPMCDHTFTDIYVSLSRIHRNDYSDIVCDFCGGEVVKLPAAPNFTIKGYAAKNGYTTKG